MSDKKYSTADVAAHRDEANGYWLIVENDVYDVSSKSRAASLAFLPCLFCAQSPATPRRLPRPAAAARCGASPWARGM